MKPDHECRPITLVMRKYYDTMRETSKRYYYENKDRINQQRRDRYNNDPGYKAKQNATRVKNQRLAAQRAKESDQ